MACDVQILMLHVKADGHCAEKHAAEGGHNKWDTDLDCLMDRLSFFYLETLHMAALNKRRSNTVERYLRRTVSSQPLLYLFNTLYMEIKSDCRSSLGGSQCRIYSVCWLSQHLVALNSATKCNDKRHRGASVAVLLSYSGAFRPSSVVTVRISRKFR